MTTFAQRLLAWFDEHGRKGLPWQHPRSAYRVWVSEIMLQQTQVQTVIPYFERFMQSFPDIAALADASQDDVLSHWAGLGYYARARNLHKAAQIVLQAHGSELPDTYEALVSLPGIGRSTAGAILAQAHGQRIAILDGNVKRLLARYGGIEGWPGKTAVSKKLWALSESLLPNSRLADYTQAQMDMGATLCTRRNPKCYECPLTSDCRAYIDQRVSELPHPRPKKIRPLRYVTVLILKRQDGAVLLERRPPAGIWGGLWSLPELPLDARLDAHCADRYGLATCKTVTGSTLRHGFTHFELEMKPVVVSVQEDARCIMESTQLCWFTGHEKSPPGMPAPVKSILQKETTFNLENVA